jgi:hypothetical protein
LLKADEPRLIDDIVEESGLNSSEVLGYALRDGNERHCPAIAGKQFSKVLL